MTNRDIHTINNKELYLYLTSSMENNLLSFYQKRIDELSNDPMEQMEYMLKAAPFIEKLHSIDEEGGVPDANFPLAIKTNAKEQELFNEYRTLYTDNIAAVKQSKTVLKNMKSEIAILKDKYKKSTDRSLKKNIEQQIKKIASKIGRTIFCFIFLIISLVPSVEKSSIIIISFEIFNLFILLRILINVFFSLYTGIIILNFMTNIFLSNLFSLMIAYTFGNIFINFLSFNKYKLDIFEKILLGYIFFGFFILFLNFFIPINITLNNLILTFCIIYVLNYKKKHLFKIIKIILVSSVIVFFLISLTLYILLFFLKNLEYYFQPFLIHFLFYRSL